MCFALHSLQTRGTRASQKKYLDSRICQVWRFRPTYIERCNSCSTVHMLIHPFLPIIYLFIHTETQCICKDLFTSVHVSLSLSICTHGCAAACIYPHVQSPEEHMRCPPLSPLPIPGRQPFPEPVAHIILAILEATKPQGSSKSDLSHRVGYRNQGTRATLHGIWDLSPILMIIQQVLLATQPSLQPLLSAFGVFELQTMPWDT